MKKQQQLFATAILTLFLASIIASEIAIPVHAETTSLEMWYMQEDFLDDTMLDLIAQYETDHDVNVNLTYIPKDSLRMEFKNAYSSGKVPDLIQGDAEWIPDLAHRNYIAPLAVNDLQYNYIPQALRAVSYFYVENGEYNTQMLAYYGIPQTVDVMAFVYNKDKVNTATIPEIGGSWDMAAFQQAITRMNDQSLPDNKQFGFSFLNFKDAELTLFKGDGGILFENDSVDAQHNKILENYSIDALNYIYNIVNYYELTPSYKTGFYVNVDNSLKTDKIYDDFAINENVSSTMLFAQDMKKLTSDGIFSDISKLGLAPTPKNSKGKSPFLEVTAIMISNSTTKREDALNLANYLCSPDSMKEYAINEFLLPAIDSVYSDESLSNNFIIQSYKPLVEQAEGVYISRFWDLYIKDIFESEVTAMIRDAQNGSTCATSLQVRIDAKVLRQADHPAIGQDISSFKFYGETSGGISFGSPSLVIISSIIGLGLVSFFTKKWRKYYEN
ncbi:MAG: extracellular solute-binding protein [Candidatus Lokiarchaeota archaeon]|nr:extracellular solute-binding protein [Candidatus Harpocratesius repetitus]